MSRLANRLLNKQVNKKTFQICEYGVIRNVTDYDREAISNLNELYLPEKSFDSLFNFILENQSAESEKDPPFTLFMKSGRKQIKVKNYVGIIETADGVSVEILPKIHLNKSKDETFDTKKIFLKMLSHLKDSPFVSLKNAHLFTDSNFPILEVFINSFVAETENAFSQGVKSDYLTEEENLNFFRGKLQISSNIKLNSTKRTSFYCKFTEFSQNIPQNRIIKTALLKLVKITKSHLNRTALSKILSYLDTIDNSINVQQDISLSKSQNRLFEKYKTLLEWSEIFLLNKSFTNFKGDSLNTAILFPMEKIFEDYIGFLFSRFATCYRVKLQDKTYFLVEEHLNSPKFRLNPDLYLENGTLERIIIDTKWKLIDENAYSKNYCITSADMYQLYAYGRKYSANEKKPKLIMIYPLNPNFKTKLDTFRYENDLNLEVVPFALDANAEEEIKKILSLVSQKSQAQ